MTNNPSLPDFWRSPRLKRALPDQEITIPDPPPAPAANNTALLISLLPVGLMALVMVGVGMASGATTMLMFSLPMILASGVASAIIFQMQKRTAARHAADRLQRYRALLQEYDLSLQRYGVEQYTLRLANDPSPAECLQWVQSRQRTLWARTPGDDDFLCVRLGIGQLPSTITVKTPTSHDVLDPDPLVVEAQNLARRHADIVGVPICLDLRRSGVVGIGGERSEAIAAAHALLLQLVTLHAPDEVKVAAIFPAGEQAEWEWLRWLPHTWRNDRSHRLLAASDGRQADDPDAIDPVRRALAFFDHLLDMRRRMLADSHSSSPVAFEEQWVVLLADPATLERSAVVHRLEREGAELGVYPIFMGGRTRELPAGCRAVIKVTAGSGSLIRPGVSTSQQVFTADRVDATLIDTFALAMAPLRLKQQAGRAIPASVALLELLRVERVEDLPIARNWRESAAFSRSLLAPIGLGAGGERLVLDLHERADGPNGLVAGMVGAGKSELLQTLVIALAVQFHPERLAFVLVDFKGGGMAIPFKHLPHTLGIITNLQEESLALRAITSFRVELKRREQLLEDAGVNHIDDYQRKYYNGELTTPLPYLVVIVDEFAEMKTEQPETAREFVRIARVGRALGLRLILAMQKPAGIVDGQIEANTRFRLCLRVAQTEDSQAMLKCPDAAYLNGLGRAFLQVGANEKFQEFQVAYSGAPYDPQRTIAGDPLEITCVSLDGSRRLLYAPGRAVTAREQTQLLAVVAHLQQVASDQAVLRTAELWQEPLPQSLALQSIRPATSGWDGQRWLPAPAGLVPVVGILDEPQLKRQRPLELNLGKEGHLAIYSAPGYGKTTFLQTLVTSLALAYSPAEVNIYILDFGSRVLKLFSQLPHVGAAIAADETERVERLLLLLQRKLDERRQLFGAASASSLAAYRELTGHDEPAIVVIIDNFANLVDAFGDDEAPLELIGRLAREGGNLGIHLVVTANNTTTIRFSITSNIMLAVALHLVEASEAGSIVGRFENLKPAAVPGRGLWRGNPPLECQIALPVEGATDAERTQALRALVATLDQAWQGRRPMPVRVLEEVVTLAEAEQAAPPRDARPQTGLADQAAAERLPATIGLHVDDLTRFGIALHDGPHFLIAGPGRSGKSTLLRTWAHALARHGGSGVRLYVIDSLRRTLEPLCTLAQVVAYSSSPEQTDALLSAVERDLRAGAGTGDGRSPVLDEASCVLLIDDFGDNYEGGTTEEQRKQVAALMRAGRNRPFHLLLAGRTSDLSSLTYYEPLRTLKEAQVGFTLGSGDDALFNTRLPYQERSKLLPLGEGYYINRTQVRRIKIAVPDATQDPAPGRVLA